MRIGTTQGKKSEVMEKKIEVGQRVAVYGYLKNKYGNAEFWRGKRCVIVNSPCAPDEYQAQPLEDPTWEVTVHPKQCRRLVPRKRMEFWLSMHPCSVPRVHSRHDPELICGSGCKIEWVRVREVLPKKGGKP